MTDSRSTDQESGFPRAHQQRTRWPGWVWLIPAAAIIVAAWMSAQEWLFGPHQLTVHFADVEGVKPGAPVRYKGVQVGSVDEIALNEDLEGATLVLDMTALDERLGEGTKVWIVRPGLEPGQITNIISGAYLAIEPGEPGQVEEIAGDEQRPIIEPDEPGRVFVLTDDEAGRLESGAAVRHRGVDVGRVLGTRFGEAGAVEIPVFVRGEFADLVREATVFWRAGGLELDQGAGGLDLDFPSLGAVVTGAVAFDTPEVLEGTPAEPGAQFALWQTRDAAATATTGPRFAYSIVFADPVGDLAQGAPVTLGGKQVGRVAGTELEVATGGRDLVTPVTVVIDARRMGLDLETASSRQSVREELDTIIERLAGIGMRARVAEGGIVFGAKSIELVIIPDAGPAPLDRTGELPRIPAENGLEASAASAPAGAAPGEAEAQPPAEAGAAGSAGAGGAASRGGAGSPDSGPEPAGDAASGPPESAGEGGTGQ